MTELDKNCRFRPRPRNVSPQVRPPGCSAAWLARLLWEQEAAGSNPAIPTRFFECVVSSLNQVRGAVSCHPTSVGVAGWLSTL